MGFAEACPEQVAALRATYDRMGHAYHNWAHIQALLRDFRRLGPLWRAPDAVELAVYFHDIVYVPGAADNEARSAAALTAQLSGPLSGRICDRTLAQAEALILATATHRVPDGIGEIADDCALFLDMDLAILGADPQTFVAYDQGIRTEFSAIPWPVYRPARQAVLQGFLDRNAIYLTPSFRQTHEAAARRNLAAAVKALAA